jgi:hypothetical protein
MHPTLHKILILLVSCSFFLSATETNIGSYHQTFFDADDTYIPSTQEDLQVPNNLVFLQKSGLPLLSQYTNFLLPSSLKACYLPCLSDCDQPLTRRRKIFLYNSSLLI